MKVEFGVLFTSIEVDDKVISNFLGQINGQVVVSLTSEVDSTPVVLVAPTVPSIPTTVHHVSSTVPTTVPAQDIWSGCTSIKNTTPDHNKDLAKDFFDNYARGRGRLDDLTIDLPTQRLLSIERVDPDIVFLGPIWPVYQTCSMMVGQSNRVSRCLSSQRISSRCSSST